MHAAQVRCLDQSDSVGVTSGEEGLVCNVDLSRSVGGHIWRGSEMDKEDTPKIRIGEVCVCTGRGFEAGQEAFSFASDMEKLFANLASVKRGEMEIRSRKFEIGRRSFVSIHVLEQRDVEDEEGC